MSWWNTASKDVVVLGHDDIVSRPSHNLSGNGRAATSRDIDMTNRDLARAAERREAKGRASSAKPLESQGDL